MNPPPAGNVTFLFADVTGTIALMGQNRDAVEQALVGYHDLLVRCTDDHAGFVFQGGESDFRILMDRDKNRFLAAFPSAGQALEAALTVQRTLSREMLPIMRRIGVRIALHTAAAAPVDGRYRGPGPDCTSQLLSAAGFGRVIVLSQSTEALVRDLLPPLTALQNIGRQDTPACPEPAFRVQHPALPDGSLSDEAEAETVERGRMLYHASRQVRDRGDYAQAWTMQQESLTIAQQIGDERAVSGSYTGLGNIAFAAKEFAQARAMQEVTLTLVRPWGNARETANSLSNLARAAFYQGDYAAAQPPYEEALALYRQLDDPYKIASVLNMLGGTTSARENVAAAQAFYRESLIFYRQQDNFVWIANTLSVLANIEYKQEDYAAARSLYAESLAIWRQLEDQAEVGTLLYTLGNIAFQQQDYAAARAFFDELLSLFRQMGDEQNVTAVLERLALLPQSRS